MPKVEKAEPQKVERPTGRHNKTPTPHRDLPSSTCSTWSVAVGVCVATSAEELVNDADERLLSKVQYCSHHVLGELLPPKSDSQHNLKKRRHNLTLLEKKGHI